MNVKSGLNLLDYLATGINKADPVIKAVLSNEDGEGATANELEAVIRFINYFSRTDNVINHKGRSLEMIAKLFTKLRRRVNESDTILMRRLLSLTHRRGDEIWGNSVNLKHVFEIYFNGIACYVAENTNEDNYMPDGDFEDQFWLLNGGASYNKEARFSGNYGLLFDGGANETCEQEVKRLYVAGNYTFHFMLSGKCGVIIQREDGKYWNANDQKFSGDTVLEWVNEEYINIFDKRDGWDDAYCFIVLHEDTTALTFKFISIEGESAFIDHARLFLKPLNPSYTLIFQYSGYTITDNTLHIGIDGTEPIEGLDYNKESYFNKSFIIGPTAVSQRRSAFISLLNDVKPRGIQVFIEFVDKKEQED